jgi:hypothetical protein
MHGYRCKASCVEFHKICLNSRWWFLLCLVYVSRLVLVLVAENRDYLNYLLQIDYAFT